MISMPNPTQSLTSQPLTEAQRENLIELITERYLDQMNGRDLERFFLDVQGEYLSGYTDSELLGEVDDVLDAEEYSAVVEDLAQSE